MRRTEPPPDNAWTDWGGDGPLLHLAHANGFPAATYRTLIAELIGSFHVETLDARPMWSSLSPQSLRDWRPLVEDLCRGFEDRGLTQVVGVGHSLGATVSGLAACERPELFASLVLIDPVIFTGARPRFWRLVKMIGLGHRLPLVQSALRRREHWPDLSAVRAAYRHKPTFAGWDDRVFEDYLAAGFAPVPDGGVTLRYPRQWEARIFESTPADIWRRLRRLRLPVLILRGETSDTFTQAAARRAERELANVRVQTLEGCSHFVPMEQPGRVADSIEAFVGKVLP